MPFSKTSSLIKFFGLVALQILVHTMFGMNIRSYVTITNNTNSSTSTSIGSLSGNPERKLDYSLCDSSYTDIQAPNDFVTCVGGTATFTVSTQGSYQWESSTDGGVNWNTIPGETTSVLTLSGVTISMNGYIYRCLIDATLAEIFNLTVNPLPVVTTANTATICSGTSPNISLTASVPSSFTWTVGTIMGGITGASSGSGPTINQILTSTSSPTGGTVEYFVTPTSTTGSCAGAPYRILVTVTPTPAVTNSPTKNICSGSSTNISLTASVPSSFTWTVGMITGEITGASASSGSSINQVLTNSSNVSAGTVDYIVTPTATTGSCAGVPYTVTVTVDPAPVVTTAHTLTICNGSTPNIDLTATIPSNFTWTVGTIAGGITGASAGSGTTINQVLVNPGNMSAGSVDYIVTPTSVSGSCVGSPYTITVTVNPSPVVTSVNRATICSESNTGIHLTASAPSTFTWTIGSITGGITGASAGSGSTISQVLDNPSNSTSGTVEYIVTPTATVGSCTGIPSIITVTVIPKPIGTNFATVSTCSGANLNIALTASIPSTFSWIVGTITGGITGASAGSGPTINQTLTNPSSITTGSVDYIVTPTSVSGSCVGIPYHITVTVNPAPAGTTINPAAICSGSSPTINLSATIASNFSWTIGTITGGTTGASSGTGSLINQTLNSPTGGTVQYLVTPISISGACPGNPQTITATVNPVPVVTNSPAISSCSGLNVNLPLTASAPSNFTWTVGTIRGGITGASAGSGNTISQILFNPSSISAGTVDYIVTPTASVGSCAGSPFTITVTIYPVPVVTSPSIASVCSTTSPNIPLTASTPSTFSWTIGTVTGGITGAYSGSGTAINQMLTNPSNTTAGTVAYIVTPTAVAGSCTGAPYTITVTVNPSPVLTSPASATICGGGSPNLPLTASDPSTFTWTVGTITGGITGASSGSASTINQTLTNPSNSASGTVQYRVTPTSANGSCAVFPVVITVNPTPVVTNSATASTCSGTGPNIALTASVPCNFSWTIGTITGGITGASASSGAIINQTLTNPSNSSAGTVEYLVTPTSTSTLCAGTPYSIVVTVKPAPGLTTPTTASICSGANLAIPLTASIPSNFFWTIGAISGSITGASSGSGLIINQTLTNPSSSVAGTVDYIVTPIATTGSCTGSPTTITVTVNPAPVVTTPATASICSGTSPNINLTSSIPSTFTWSIGTITGGITGVSAGSGNSISQILTNPSNSVTGTVVYIVTPTAGSCKGTPYSIVVTVYPKPVITNAPTVSTCSGINSNIPLTASTSSSFTWTVGAITGGITGASAGSGNSINQTLINPSNTVAGTVAYIVTPTSTAGSCIGLPFTITVTVNPATIVTTANAFTICSGTSPNISLTATVPSTFSWTVGAITGGITGASGGNGSTINQTLINPSSAVGSIEYIVTPISLTGSCPGIPYSITVTVDPAPAVTVPATAAICSGTSPNISLTATMPSTFSWTVGAITGGITGASAGTGAAINQTLTNPNNAVAGTVVYIVTPTPSAGSCAGAPYTITVTVRPTPVLVSSLSVPAICSNSIFSYNPISSTSNTTFNWTRAAVPGINSTASGTGNPNETLVNTTNVPVNVTYVYTLSANGCTNPTTFNVMVTVNPLPSLSSTLTPSPICSNTVFNYTPTSSDGIVTGWTRMAVAGISNPAASGTANPNEILVNTTASPVNVTYVYTVVLGGCSNLQNVVVTVYPNPVLLGPLTPSAICSNSVFSYAPASSTIGATFNWSRKPVAGISNLAGSGMGNPNETLVNTTAAAIPVTYTYQVAANGCNSTQNVVVSVKPLPVLTSSLTPPAICSNTPFIYMPQSNAAGTIFSWSRPSVAGIANPTATGIGNPNETLLNLTNTSVPVTYIYTLSANGCTNPVTFSVVVNVSPAASLSSSLTPPGTCSGSIFNYSATGTTAGAVMTWTRAAVSGIVQSASGGTGNISEFLTNTTAAPINVTYQYSVSANGCTNIQNVVVPVNPAPVLSSSQTPPAICSGNVFHYAATSATTGTVFTWARAALPGISQPASAGTGDVNETLTNTTNAPLIVNYSYSLTANGCAGSTYNIPVTVNPTPTLPVITPSGPVSFCAGGNVILSAPSGYSSYLWSNGAATQNITISTVGSYSVVVKDGNGCQSASSAPVSTVVLPAATTYAGSDGLICAGDNFNITGASASNYSSFLWSSSGTGTFINSTTLSPTYVPSIQDQTNGAVTLTLAAYSILPCATTVRDDMILTIRLLPTVEAGMDKTVCYPASVLVNGTATNYRNPVWTHNGTGTLTSNNTLSPTYHPGTGDVGNTVKLTLSVDALNPCSATITDFMFIQVGAVPGNPGAISGPVGSRCKGTTATYSVPPVTGVINYNWSLPAGITIASGANSNTINVLFGPTAVSGNITLYGSNSCGNGVVSTLPVVVADVPANPGSISGNPSVCQGSIGEVFSVSPVAGATGYTWTVPSGATITSVPPLSNSITVDFGLASMNGNVTVFATNGCGISPVATKAIKVNSKPVTPVISATGGPTTFCEGGSIRLSGPTNGFNYLWSPGGATTQTNVISTSGNYSVVVTDPLTGCSSAASNTISVVVNPAPQTPASIGFITSCLDGGPIPTLNANTVTSTAVGTTIFWFDAPVAGNPVVTPSLNAIGSITYYAEARDNLTACNSLLRTPVKLTISNNPAPPVAGPSVTVCQQSPVQTLTATATSAAGTTILWYTTPTGGLPVSPTLSSVGTKTFYAEASNGVCTSLTRSAGVKLTILGAPEPPVSGGDIMQCLDPSPQTIVPTATAPAGCTVKWYDASSGGNLLAFPSYSGLGTKTFYAESVNTLTNCSSLTRTAVTISIVIHPPAPVPGPDVNECEKSPLQTIVASASVPTGFNVKWYTKAVGGTLVATPSLHAIGVVTYYAETDNGICSSSSRSAVTLRINPAPAPPTSMGNIMECEHSPIQTLTADASVPSGVTIAWYTTASGGYPITSPTLSEPGTVTYYAEANSGTCTSITRSLPIVLTILATPEAPVSNGDQIECEKSPLQVLTASATAPAGSTVKWYTTASGGTAIASPTLNKVGSIIYYAESENGNCSSYPNFARTAVKLQIDPAPQIPVSLGNITECEKSPIQTLTAKASATGSAIAWYTSAVGGEPIPYPALDAVGTITYYAEAVNGTCISTKRSAPIVLTINPTPDQPVSLGDVAECLAKPIPVLTAKVETPPAGVAVTWYSAPTGGSIIATPTLNIAGIRTYYAEAKQDKCTNPTRTPVKLTIYSAVADPILKVNGQDSIVSCESSPIVPLDARDLFTVIPGVTYVCFDELANGFEVSPVLNYIGTKRLYVAAKNTTTNCYSLKRIPVKLAIHAVPPKPVSKGDIFACAQKPLQTLDANNSITPPAGYTVKWYTSATLGIEVAQPTLNTVKDTTYYASYVDKITNCESMIRAAVKLSIGSPSASAASNSPLSLGQTLLLKGGPDVPGNTYRWTDPNGFSYSTMDVTIPNVTASLAGKYKLTVTSQNGCTAIDSVMVVLGIARAEAQSPVCIGATLYLSGFPDNMKSYAWSGPNGFTSSLQNPSIGNVTIANSGTYTLTVTNTNNATSSDTVSVSFKPLPLPVADYSTVCPAGTLQLNAGPNGMTSYMWSGPGGFTSKLQNPAPFAYPNPPVNFKLTVVDWNGCEASKTITPAPFQPKATYNSPLCSGDTLRLRGEPNGMASYRWSGPNSFVSTLQSPSINNTNAATATGDYILTVVKDGCTYSTKVTVQFNSPAPVPTITPNMNPICEGSTLILNGAPSGMAKYEWTGPNEFTSTDQKPQIPAMDALKAGVYSLQITNSTGCRNSFETSISVNSVTFNGTYGPYCISDSPVTLSVSPVGGTFSGPGISGNIFNPKVAGEGSHVIQYTYSLSGGLCSLIATKIIDVVTAPKVVTSNPVLKSCSGTTADLTLPAVTEGSTPGLIMTYWKDAKATITLASPRSVAAGLYYIKGATMSGKCYDIQPVTVMQPDSLHATLTALSALNCAGDSTGSLTVNVTMGTAPYNYLWSTQPAQTTATATNLRAGIYTILVTDAKMCTAAFTGEVTEPAPIKLGFSTKPIQCLSDENGSSRVDTINGSTDINVLNSYKYSWATNPVQTTREAVRLTAWWHKVTLTGPKGCIKKDSVFIDVLDYSPPTIVCPKDIEMTVPYIKSTDGSPNKYVVDLGKPYTLDNCQVDTVTNDAPAKFRTGLTYVIWTVTDQMGLTDTCTQRVYVKEIPTIPQLISPNGDGVNDKFIIDGLTGSDYQGSQMLIFTRSGQLVFQSNNYEQPDNAWDGRYTESNFSKNKLVAPGVYYYILKLGGSSSQTMKGYIYVYY